MAPAPVTHDATVLKLTGAQGDSVVQLYRYPGISPSKAKTLLRTTQRKVSDKIVAIDGEICFNIELTAPLNDQASREPAETRSRFCVGVALNRSSSDRFSREQEASTLAWLLRETFEPELTTSGSKLATEAAASDAIVEVGPRMSFSTAWSTNAASICQSVGLSKVRRIELSRRYLLKSSTKLGAHELNAFAALVHDRMTEQVSRWGRAFSGRFRETSSEGRLLECPFRWAGFPGGLAGRPLASGSKADTPSCTPSP